MKFAAACSSQMHQPIELQRIIRPCSDWDRYSVELKCFVRALKRDSRKLMNATVTKVLDLCSGPLIIEMPGQNATTPNPPGSGDQKSNGDEKRMHKTDLLTLLSTDNVCFMSVHSLKIRKRRRDAAPLIAVNIGRLTECLLSILTYAHNRRNRESTQGPDCVRLPSSSIFHRHAGSNARIG